MKKLIIANWKMNPVSQKEAQKMLGVLSRGASRVKNEIVVCPPFVYLPLAKKMAGKNITIGAQNCFWEKKGAFTGEISPAMLKDMGVRYVIVGHSEREIIMAEKNEMTNKKIKLVLAKKMVPVLCVGETAEQKKENTTFAALEKEIKECLKGVRKEDIGKVVIAYEPVWAIGAKNPCSADQAITIALFIRKLIGQMASKKQASALRVLYGGSVSPDNASNYLASPWLNGLLVGSNSLEAKEFLAIAKAA